MTTRLPTPGSDDGAWGDVLNAYLEVGHDSTGLNVGPVVEATKATGFTLTTAHNGTRIVATAAITITVPSVGTLMNGFECEIINDSGGTVTIDGPGASNVLMDNGDVATILEVNNKQLMVKGNATVLS